MNLTNLPGMKKLFIDQIGQQTNSVFLNDLNTQFIQNLLPIKFFKEFASRYIVKASSCKAIDVRHHDIDIFLCEVFQVSPFGNDFSKIEMIVLHMSFLLGRIWIAVKNLSSFFS